jgi:hypothetical protein
VKKELRREMEQRADESAKCDLESNCVPAGQSKGYSWWYDSHRCGDQSVFDKALRYAELRGDSLPWRVIWHHRNNGWFRIEDVE